MISISVQDLSIEIKLDNGLYLFISESAAGKTYMGELIKLINSVKPEWSERLVFVSSKSEVDTNSIRLMENGILILDRYDLYQSKELTDLIVQASKTNIVLLDLKAISRYKLGLVSFCKIERTRNAFKVVKV